MSKKRYLSKSLKTSNDKDDQNNVSALPGWPGYRTRDGRSGYDPIDTRTEAGHAFGIFMQKLFTGQLKTSNPIYLFILCALGLILTVPLFLAVTGIWSGNLFSWDAWILFLVTGIIGFAMLINFIKNLFRIRV